MSRALWRLEDGATRLRIEFGQYLQSRRGKSRNKVAVGEPAAGSFLGMIPFISSAVSILFVLPVLENFTLDRAVESAGFAFLLRSVYLHVADDLH